MATDADDPCRLTLGITPPAHGSLTPLAPVPCASSLTFGSFRYTPADGWVGADSFTAVFRDPHGLESSVVARLDVPPPTDTFTVLASEDTWVDETKPTANYRYGLSLVLDTSPQRQAYLRSRSPGSA